MKYLTISDVSKTFEVSTRMIRYYEKIGLIYSIRKEDYTYRIYDEYSVRRLQQIILLRKLHIPLKQISIILNDSSQLEALNVMKENIEELNNEINALSTIRNILNVFVSHLNEKINKGLSLDLLEDSEIVEIVNTLSLSKSNLKEDFSMEKLNETQKVMDSKMDIRIIYLPPVTVASSQFIGENPEDNAGEQLNSFIENSKLFEIKKDSRVYGFNNPSPKKDQQFYGYEFWVTIPDDMQVNAPLEVKKFEGGLYAAHCIKMGDFHEWKSFCECIKNNEEYEIEHRDPLGMNGCLEEHLNAFSYYTGLIPEFSQIDLLIPIKKKI